MAHRVVRRSMWDTHDIPEEPAVLSVPATSHTQPQLESPMTPSSFLPLLTPTDVSSPVSLGPAIPRLSTDETDEIPLLEELDIDFGLIVRKSFSILNPFSRTRRTIRGYFRSHEWDRAEETDIVKDQDIIGPIIFALLLGTVLLMKGEVHFGNIYGCGTIGCLSVWVILNLMSTKEHHLSIWRTVSVFGYNLLPIIFFATVEVVLGWFVRGATWFLWVHRLGCVVVVIWSTTTATEMFIASLRMMNKYYLVAYPVGLLFSTFLLMTL